MWRNGCLTLAEHLNSLSRGFPVCNMGSILCTSVLMRTDTTYFFYFLFFEGLKKCYLERLKWFKYAKLNRQSVQRFFSFDIFHIRFHYVCFVLSSDLGGKKENLPFNQSFIPLFALLSDSHDPSDSSLWNKLSSSPPASPSGFTFTGSGTRTGSKTCEDFFTGNNIFFLNRGLYRVGAE